MVVLLSLSSIIHWRAIGKILYAHWIAKLLYAMNIYIFCNQCDQKGPRKPFVVYFNLTRKEETQIHRCLLILMPFIIQPNVPLAVEALRQNLALRIYLRKHENLIQLTVKTALLPGGPYRKPLVASLR